MRYVLKDTGYKWKTIHQGRKPVGRVFQHEQTKMWTGIIGAYTATGSDERSAFMNVAAKALGFDSPESVRAHNASVRSVNRTRKATARRALDSLLAGDYTVLDRMFTGGVEAAKRGQ